MRGPSHGVIMGGECPSKGEEIDVPAASGRVENVLQLHTPAHRRDSNTSYRLRDSQALQAVVGRVLQGIGFDRWMEHGGIKQFFDQAETNQTPHSILGALV